MYRDAAVAVVIPALNEEGSIGRVIEAIPAWVGEVIVADNGSSDRTAEVAASQGARVVTEPRRGYGAACQAALAGMSRAPDIVVFMDADLADDPGRMTELVEPIVQGRADLVIGSRVLGLCEPGALTALQRFGNRLSCDLIALFWGVRFTDLGPFRAIRRESLLRLKMEDRNYGWTAQMQARAARMGLRCVEIPVPYRRRAAGRSKVSGTLRGALGAGRKILYTILREALRPSPKCEKAGVVGQPPNPAARPERAEID